MRLAWLEDFVCIYKHGHFAKAAEERGITQPALSRRIQSLELWAGGELFDRTHHPVQLTSTGVMFLETANAIISMAYEAKSRLWPHTSFNDTHINIACLHTLAIVDIPEMISDLQDKVGAFKARIVAETRTVEEYLMALTDETCDLFVCYDHPSFPFAVDSSQYDQVKLKNENLNLYFSETYKDEIYGSKSKELIPLLKYSGTAFMSRVVETVIEKTAFAERLQTVLEASLAESLKTAAISNHGVAWLPQKLAEHNTPPGVLLQGPPEYSTELSLIAYRKRSNKRPVVERVWQALLSMELECT